jgi:hypothetical protein
MLVPVEYTMGALLPIQDHLAERLDALGRERYKEKVWKMPAPRPRMAYSFQHLHQSPRSKSRMPARICRVILQTKCLWLGEDGKDTVEYGLLMVLVFVSSYNCLGDACEGRRYRPSDLKQPEYDQQLS